MLRQRTSSGEPLPEFFPTRIHVRRLYYNGARSYTNVLKRGRAAEYCFLVTFWTHLDFVGVKRENCFMTNVLMELGLAHYNNSQLHSSLRYLAPAAWRERDRTGITSLSV